MSVYFIQSGDAGPIKIGHAKDVKKRMQYLQIGQADELRLLACMDGGANQERGLHRKFAEHRISGEWFKPHSDILNERELYR